MLLTSPRAEGTLGTPGMGQGLLSEVLPIFETTAKFRHIYRTVLAFLVPLGPIGAHVLDFRVILDVMIMATFRIP